MKPKLVKAVGTPYGVHCYTANSHTQLSYRRPGTVSTRQNGGDDFSLTNGHVFRAATVQLNCVLPASFR